MGLRFMAIRQNVIPGRLNRFLIHLFSAGVFLMTGCASSEPTLNLAPTKGVLQGVLKTEGVRITATDGSFELVPGRTFTTPFQIDAYNILKAPGMNQPDLASRAVRALEIGGQRVLVANPYTRTPLHGVLLFSKLPMNATGPGSRSHYIEVPESYAREALGGRTSVVYERVQLTGGGEWFNWALWMSDVDFPPLSREIEALPRSLRERVALQTTQRDQEAAVAQASSSDGGDDSGLALGIILVVVLVSLGL